MSVGAKASVVTTHRVDDLAEPDLNRRKVAPAGGVDLTPLGLALALGALALFAHRLVVLRVVLLRVEEAVVVAVVALAGLGDLGRRGGRLCSARVVDELAEFALPHLGRPEAEDEEERVDRVRLARAVGPDDGREGLSSERRRVSRRCEEDHRVGRRETHLVEGTDHAPALVTLEVLEDKLVDDEARLALEVLLALGGKCGVVDGRLTGDRGEL